MLAQVSSEVANMGKRTQRRIKKATVKAVLFLGLMALMMVPGPSEVAPAAPAAPQVFAVVQPEMGQQARVPWKTR
jgi:hypothetical protein